MSLTKQEALRKIRELEEYVREYSSNEEPLYKELRSMSIPEDHIHRVATNSYRVGNGHGGFAYSVYSEKIFHKFHATVSNGDLKIYYVD